MTETDGASDDWRGFLTRWSAEWADAYDPDEVQEAGDEEARRTRWLGFEPATPERIAALEERLEHRLPPSYRTFLEVTDGWRHAGGFVWLLAGTDTANWHEDDAGLAEIYQEDLDENATREEVLEATIWTRGLELAVESDAMTVMLDPEDVDAHGEWAVYTWAPWRASPPERHASFWEFMQDAYREFHSLRAGADDAPEFVNATTEALDAEVEQARRDALRGDFERAEAVFAQARAFGRPRAGALRDQIVWLLGDRYSTHFDGLAADPVYAPDLLPALIAGRGGRPWHGEGAYAGYVRGRSDEVCTLERLILRQLREGTYAYTAPGPFGDAVQAAREQARWGETDAAWRTLLIALPQWQPLGVDHLAPVGLAADPLLGPLLTQERGRALLATPRGEEATGSGSVAVDEDPPGMAWLAERPSTGQRQGYRFLLVEGVEPDALPTLIGAEDGAELFEPMTLWDARSKLRSGGTSSSYDDKALVAVGRAGGGWSFAFDGMPKPFNEARFTSPAVAASRHGRAVVVWASPDDFGRGALFHLSVAERATERYAFTVLGERCDRSGEIPQDLDPDRLFPELRSGGQNRELPGEAAALTAIATTFGATLPRFALDDGRLHTFVTRSWTRPPGAGETYIVITSGPPGAHTSDA
ncbi:SMI1/KNR4 family protein [Streptomyces kanamyceticus]|uniref:SMI1/KNR4 family protein n=1 Tax=Streptomyces kanamyceticus TaxID=1967 RepID=A0A5J6GV81_STRKN|nr:SMI1/KNR4 family protein [Streptomyces kanamyceticus]QEU96916.1 SMI1/KNR4 family protein [Streptomyces kanamyceticus]